MSTQQEQYIAQSRDLIAIMNKQLESLNEFTRSELAIRDYIRQSDWERLNNELSILEPVFDHINELESQRDRAFLALIRLAGLDDVDKTPSFYRVIAALPPELKEESAAVYRSLKKAVVSIQSITWSIDDHVRAVSETVRTALEEVYPHRKGKIYSKKGTSDTTSVDPLLVNQSL